MSRRAPALPEEAVQILRDLHGDWPRQNATMALARLNGWTARAIGDAIGTSRWNVHSRVERWLSHGGQYTQAVDLPLPPPRPSKMPKPPRYKRLLVKPEVADRLRALHALARTVNGGTAADDPRREASVELTAALAALVEQGVTTLELAKELGVYHRAITSRLERHGYRKSAPSTADQRYTGLGRYPHRRGFCANGHELTGGNVGFKQGGKARYCKECNRRRSREYYRRKVARAS